MRTVNKWPLFVFVVFIISFNSGCSRKMGCPGNGKNVGAEKLMSGEKVPKAKKFKS